MPSGTGNRRDSNRGSGFNRRSGGVADWASVDKQQICDLISTASATGGAVRFGYSQDGGAYAVGIYANGEHQTEFFSPNEDSSVWMNELIIFYQDLRDIQNKPK